MTDERKDAAATVASHEGAVAAPADEPRCDACSAVLPLAEDDEGFDVPGHGMYVWTRGEEVRFEKVPLCASCASAIGMTALGRWEIEEEEG
jgi:hypothetical protein